MLRLGLAMYEQSGLGDATTARVVLEFDGVEREGTATGESSYAFAAATLDAVANALSLEDGFRVLESVTIELVTGDVAIVTCVAKQATDKLLVGAAPIRSDGPQSAVCRAALDAVNRIVTRRLATEPASEQET